MYDTWNMVVLGLSTYIFGIMTANFLNQLQVKLEARRAHERLCDELRGMLRHWLSNETNRHHWHSFAQITRVMKELPKAHHHPKDLDKAVSSLLDELIEQKLVKARLEDLQYFASAMYVYRWIDGSDGGEV